MRALFCTAVVSGVLALAPGAQAPSLSIVLLLDATWTTANMMAPFVMTGRRTPEDLRRPIVEGSRPPHSPEDLFGRSVDALIAALQAGDVVAIGSIATTVRMTRLADVAPGAFRQEVREVLRVPQGDRFGATPLWDGVDMALDVLSGVEGRRVVILVTDGMATGNRVSYLSVGKRANQLECSISVIHQLPSLQGTALRIHDRAGDEWLLLRSLSGMPSDAPLRYLASTTGGRYIADDEQLVLLPDGLGGSRIDPAKGRPFSLPARIVGIINEMRTAP